MFCWNCKKELTAGTLVCPCCGASIQINPAMTGTYVNKNLNNQQTTIYTNSPKQEKSKIKRVITAIRTGQKIKGLLLCDLIDIIVNTLLIGPIIAGLIGGFTALLMVGLAYCIPCVIYYVVMERIRNSISQKESLNAEQNPNMNYYQNINYSNNFADHTQNNAISAQIKYCRNCGNKYTDGTVFCGNCGNRLD